MIKFDTPLDSEDVKGADFGPMPVGDYLGFIEEAEETTSKNGNEMLHLVVRLEGNEMYDNRVLHHYLVFGLEHSLSAAKSLMVALRQDITGMKSIKAEDLVGLACKIHTKHEEYEGKVQDKIHYFVQPDEDEVPLAKPRASVAAEDEVPF